MQKTKSSTIFTILTASLSLASCAGPESYQQKMARYNPKVENKNLVPEISAYNFKFSAMTSKPGSRAPASAETSNKPEGSSEKEGQINSTNKKLYFMTLFTQYEGLKKYSMDFVGPTVSICPNFHTSLLQHQERKFSQEEPKMIQKKFSYDSSKFLDEAYVAAHPELMLSLSKEETTPKVIDILRGNKGQLSDFAVNEMVHKALDIHLAKTYNEIRELCEYGVSDNYYIYENLITHIKNNKFEADTDNMNTLLKTTVFSNYALVTSLQKQTSKPMGRSIASVGDPKDSRSPYMKELMSRLNVTWSKQYFDYISEK